MPKLSPGQPFGPIPASVTLDANGFGSVQFQATGSAVSITNLFGNVAPVAPNTDVVEQATASVYVGTISLTNRVFNNNSGSTGFTATGRIDIPDGTIIYVTWNGGDPGGVATATFSGRAIPFDQIAGGFEMRADDPIAAGDGSLIFPALRSPNYVAGVSGWKISRDGTVEFGDGTFRGEVIAGGGSVVLDEFGIIVQRPLYNQVMYVNRAAGMSVISTSGGRAQIDVFAVSGRPYLNLEPPTSGIGTVWGGAAMDSGFTVISGSVEVPWTRMLSPTANGGDPAQFLAYGERSDSSVQPHFDMFADRLRLESELDIVDISTGVERYGRGRYNLTTESGDAALTTTPSVTMTLVSATYKAGRAYEAIMDARYVSGNTPSVFLRKGTTAGGTVVVDAGRVPATIGSTLSFRTSMIFIVGSSDVTTQLNVTMATLAGTATQVGPRRVLINDIGLASDYTDYSANTLS